MACNCNKARVRLCVRCGEGSRDGDCPEGHSARGCVRTMWISSALFPHQRWQTTASNRPQWTLLFANVPGYVEWRKVSGDNGKSDLEPVRLRASRAETRATSSDRWRMSRLAQLCTPVGPNADRANSACSKPRLGPTIVRNTIRYASSPIIERSAPKGR